MEVKFRRKFTEEQRLTFVKKALEYGSNITVAKKYNLNPDLLSFWLNNYRRYGGTLVPKEKKIDNIIPNYKKEYLKLQKELKDKDLEIELLRELLEKKRIAQKKG